MYVETVVTSAAEAISLAAQPPTEDTVVVNGVEYSGKYRVKYRDNDTVTSEVVTIIGLNRMGAEDMWGGETLIVRNTNGLPGVLYPDELVRN